MGPVATAVRPATVGQKRPLAATAEYAQERSVDATSQFA